MAEFQDLKRGILLMKTSKMNRFDANHAGVINTDLAVRIARRQQTFGASSVISHKNFPCLVGVLVLNMRKKRVQPSVHQRIARGRTAIDVGIKVKAMAQSDPTRTPVVIPLQAYTSAAYVQSDKG